MPNASTLHCGLDFFTYQNRKKYTSGPRYWNVPVLVNTGTFLVYQYCLKMWYLRPLECAGVIQKLTILERKNGLVLSNTRVPVSGTWSILFPQNLFQNEISQDFSSKSLLNLLIHSNAHIHYYRSFKKGWILELEIGFRLFSSSILLEPHGIVTFDLYLIKFIFKCFIRLGIILIVCSHEILLFSRNYHLVINRNNLDNIPKILLAI